MVDGTGESPRARAEGRCRPLLVVALAFAISGCATTYGLGQTALRDGRYAEAASNFETVLNENPQRTDALVGLGIARYQQGAYDQAVMRLTQAVRQDPKRADAQLYLGLSYLQQGNDASASLYLRAFRGLTHSAQVTRQVDDALDLLRTGHGLSAESRRFVATTLESALKSERELREVQRYYAPWPYYGYYNPFFCCTGW